MHPDEHPLGVADQQTPQSWPGGAAHTATSTPDDNHPVPSSSGFVWEPTRRREDLPPANWPQKLAEATPTNSDLLRWAASPANQPPQHWWNDATDPFAADSD